MIYLLAIILSVFVVACSDSGSSHSNEPSSDNEIEVFVLLKNGSVTIGSNDKSFKVNERPAMSVILDYDFYMGIHEVTCGEYAKIAEKTRFSDRLVFYLRIKAN